MPKRKFYVDVFKVGYESGEPFRHFVDCFTSNAKTEKDAIEDIRNRVEGVRFDGQVYNDNGLDEYFYFDYLPYEA